MSASPKRPMTDDEREAILALRDVGFSPTWDKLFDRDVLQPSAATRELSDKAAAQLWRLFIRYRRQTSCPNKARLLQVAQSLSAPDFRKQAAAERELQRIADIRRRNDEIRASR